jgi:hypothetical protein
MDPQDRERHGKKRGDEPDVEAHRMKHKAHDDGPQDETETDEPDVEAHRMGGHRRNDDGIDPDMNRMGGHR